jgi:hypothetical protein
MLHAGLRYEAARDRYAPFDRLVDEDRPSRASIAGAVAAALEAGREAFVVVNNKAEGSAPRSVARLAERIAGVAGGPEEPAQRERARVEPAAQPDGAGVDAAERSDGRPRRDANETRNDDGAAPGEGPGA